MTTNYNQSQINSIFVKNEIMKTVQLLSFACLIVIIGCKKTTTSPTVQNLIENHLWHLKTVKYGGIFDSTRSSCGQNCIFSFSNDSNGVQNWDNSLCNNIKTVPFKYYFDNPSSLKFAEIYITNFGSQNANVFCRHGKTATDLSIIFELSPKKHPPPASRQLTRW